MFSFVKMIPSRRQRNNSLHDVVFPDSPSEEEETFRFPMTQLRFRIPSTAKAKEEIFQDPTQNESFFTLANQMRENNILTDIIISSEGKTFHAHKLVLASRSDYFMTMFNGPLACRGDILPLFGISSEIMPDILRYIYLGVIKLSTENLFDILNASCLLLLPNLKKRCEKFLKDRIDFDNVLQVFSYAKRFSLFELIEYSLDFISFSFNDLTKTDEFLQLFPDDLCDILSLENLSADCEDDLLYAALTWLEYDTENRIEKFEHILSNIRLNFVSNFLLQNLKTKNEHVSKNPQLVNLINDALGESPEKLNSRNTWSTPRKCMQFIPSILSMGGPSLNIYNEELDQWCELTKCKARHCPGMDVIGSDIYVVGGSLEWKRKETGEKFNTETNEWSPIANMSTARSNFGLVQQNGKLFAIGGYDGDFPLKSCEVYNPKQNAWNTIATLNRARDGACCLSDGEHLYTIGGYDGNQYLTSVEKYSESNNTWNIDEVPSMLEKRQNAMSAYWDGCIYVIGGYFSNTYHSSVEVFDIELHKWSTASPMPTPRHHAGATAINGCLFVCGGWSGQLPVRHVDVYHISLDTWSRVAPLPTPTMIRCAPVNFPKKSMLKLFKNEMEEENLMTKRKSICSQISSDSFASYSSC